MRENCGKRDIGEQENRNGEEERRNPNAEGGNKSEISRWKLKMGYRHFPWKRVGKFLNDVYRFVRAFLSISLFSLSPSFSGRTDAEHKVRAASFPKGEKEGRKEGWRRREDDREGGIHPDYANKRNGFHIWSFNEAKTIAGEEEEEEKKNVNGLHRIFKRPLLSFVLSSFSSVQLFLDSSRDHSFQVVSHTFLLSSFLSPSSFRNNPLHLPLRFYPISPPLRKISPRNVNFCLVD